MINAAHTDSLNEYYTRDRPSISSRIAAGPNVILDLGCGSGALGKKLVELNKAKQIIGVEIFKTAAEQAAKHYDKVFEGDIEAMDLPYRDCFDYVICGDILEHLKDPYRIISRIGQWLKSSGRLVCSVPNIRNYRVLANLIFRGEWRYEDSGILDATHLRFFTRKSCLRMLEEGGFRIESAKLLINGTRKSTFDRLTFSVFEEFLATQVVVVARPDGKARKSQ